MKKMGTLSVMGCSFLLGMGTYYLLNNKKQVNKIMDDIMDSACKIKDDMTKNMTK